MRTAFYLTVLGAGLVLAAPALAQTCTPPKVVATAKVVPNVTGLRRYVPLTIAGAPAVLRLDTGAEQTSITPTLAATLKLQTRKSATWTFTATGAASNQVVVTDVGFGNLVWNGAELALLPPGDINPHDEYVGLLGADLLSKYDVAIDFEHQTIDLIDPNHCPGTPPNWPGKKPVAVPIKLVAGHIEMPVVVDGHTILATLDTGAARAVILRPVAERDFGLVMGGPDTPPSSGTLNNQPGATVWHHVFQELKIGDVSLKNQQFSIIPDLFNDAEKTAEAAAAAARAKKNAKTPEPPKAEEYAMTDIIIGMAVLRNLRLYIDYKDHILYIAP